MTGDRQAAAGSPPFDFDAFVERELAFRGYLVQAPFDVLGAAEIEEARRGLWEEWRASARSHYP